MSTPPVPYERQYDFTSFATNHPKSPLPGLKVDAELNEVLTSIASLISRLAEIQRPDGALANLSVGPDQVTPDLLMLFGQLTPRGAWVTATAYKFRDLVSRNGVTYFCLADHTSGVFTTDLAANKWMGLSESTSAAFTLKGNNTGSTGPTIDLTAAEVLVMLAAMVGDAGAGGVKGLAPAPAAGDAAARKFLSAAGIWAAIQAATDVVAGILSLGTVPELRTGTEAAKAITPATLATTWKKGADIDSAATLVKPSAANLGGFHSVLNAATISAIWAGEPAGTLIELEFIQALTLTHSTTLVLPGAINVITNPGDVARFRAMGGSVWKCVSAPPTWYGPDAVPDSTGSDLFLFFYYGY